MGRGKGADEYSGRALELLMLIPVRLSTLQHGGLHGSSKCAAYITCSHAYSAMVALSGSTDKIFAGLGTPLSERMTSMYLHANVHIPH